MLIHLIGGFLGSGKTTAIQQACRILQAEGNAIAVITNDQGSQLVDTHFLEGQGIPTEEVTGSCFCCNYNAFEAHVLQMNVQLQPNILFAESVGSCTDLIATIMRPLQQFHPENQVVLSVFADAQVLPVLVSGSRLFANSVNYIYRQQLEEADVLVLSKCDLLSEVQLMALKDLVRQQYPHKTALFQNSYDDADIRRWLQVVGTFPQGQRQALELDYETYGAGEAALAWLNQRLHIRSAAGAALQAAALLINNFYQSIVHIGYPIGHLKFIYKGAQLMEKISFTSASPQNETVYLPGKPLSMMDLFINARVQTDPEQLQALLEESIKLTEQQTDAKIQVLSNEAFIPGFPKPTYRILT